MYIQIQFKEFIYKFFYKMSQWVFLIIGNSRQQTYASIQKKIIDLHSFGFCLIVKLETVKLINSWKISSRYVIIKSYSFLNFRYFWGVVFFSILRREERIVSSIRFLDYRHIIFNHFIKDHGKVRNRLLSFYRHPFLRKKKNRFKFFFLV